MMIESKDQNAEEETKGEARESVATLTEEELTCREGEMTEPAASTVLSELETALSTNGIQVNDGAVHDCWTKGSGYIDLSVLRK